MQYIVNPYQMVVNLNKYYLIGNYNKYDDVSHYRLDLMTNVDILEEPCKPMKKVKGLENGLNLGEHMREHIYMYSGENIHVKFHAKKKCMTEYIDWLGTNFKILEEDEDSIILSVKCNENAAFYWALQYGTDLEVLEPVSLRKKVYEMICNIKERYEG